MSEGEVGTRRAEMSKQPEHSATVGLCLSRQMDAPSSHASFFAVVRLAPAHSGEVGMGRLACESGVIKTRRASHDRPNLWRRLMPTRTS